MFHTLDQYVEDQLNGAVKVGDYVAECVCKLEENANILNDILNANGGGDNFLKSFCYIIEKFPKEDSMGWQILTHDENPDYCIQVREWDHDGVQVDLIHKEAKELHHTLGYPMNISDNNMEATNMHIAKANKYNNAVLRSMLST